MILQVRPGRCSSEFMAQRSEVVARIAVVDFRASLAARTGVEPELQTAGVDFLAEGGHAGGEAVWVWQSSA